MKHPVYLIATLALLSGCTFVELTPAGELVSVVQPDLVKNCERIGQTESNVEDNVGIFERSDKKVAEELETLARNSAARMGGDAIVVASPPKYGRQLFHVYQCP
ncbi:MAG: DUF4156 domain-containing protein [Pseudomonadales bacterium]|nr:DUF4156 domain-containing protein [Pseudomonadales bacterium]